MSVIDSNDHGVSVSVMPSQTKAFSRARVKSAGEEAQRGALTSAFSGVGD